jgi:hypothetical protein
MWKLAFVQICEMEVWPGTSGEVDVWCQEMCILFECTYLQSTFFVLETSLALMFIDCRYNLLPPS